MDKKSRRKCKPFSVICDGCNKSYDYLFGPANYNKWSKHFCSKDCRKKYYQMFPTENHNSKPYLMLYSAKQRAKNKGFDFNLQHSDIPPIPEYCPILGIKIELNNNKCEDNSPSLDRIDSNKGYIKGNIRIISHRANTLKSNATVKELELILKDLKKLQKS